MELLLPTIAAQLDLTTSIVGTIIAVVVSFVLITLVTSYYRFQDIVEEAESTQPEEMGSSKEEVIRVQFARYLAGCARRGTSFHFSLLRLPEGSEETRMSGPVVGAVKQALRRDDIVCVFDERTVALFTEAEPEDAEIILERVMNGVGAMVENMSEVELRAASASYPGHGLSGRELIDIAREALEETGPERRFFMPEIVDVDAEDEEETAEEPAEEAQEELAFEDEDEGAGGWKERRKSAMLDEVTGVLKPSAVSPYMQRQMNTFRHKKQAAALFCVGVNNMDHIERFHGEDAADDVLAGVSKVLQANLRADDLIGRHEKHAFLVLARCSLEEAELIGRRVSLQVQNARFESEGKTLKTQITLGVAEYPVHGRNLHQLYKAGQRVLDHSRANDIRAYAVYDPQIHDKVPSKPMKSIKSVKA